MTAVQGFAAFPRQSAGARFAATWWGRAWIKALEDTTLDHTLLRKGRAYAKTGRVGPITVSPGRLSAMTEDGHDTVVQVTRLTDAEWDRFLDQVAAQAGHIAALLDGDVPQDLVTAAEDAAVPLLPAVGDLEPDCDCPDWGHPCEHAAALCYQASWLLDGDPFVLLLLRGRGRAELLEALQLRDAPAAAPGIAAADAYALGTPPLPEPPPADVAFTPLELEEAPGVDVRALGALTASASELARELLVTGRLRSLTEYQDRVRLAAASGLDAGLEAAVLAWRYGGADGLDVLERPWTPAKADLARAAAEWERQELPAVEPWRNRWTLGSLQLRYGRDGRWYPFTDRDGDWWPAGPPEKDPAALLAHT
ncbi:SWIM zinc finger family protein [Nonomuraea longicatena]|uniref:SWIM-type domain-containing protein n=1 Tax=Nonomuraea longicatena TaxID=83682 RepID=A0ABN1NX39_9ACTN